PCAQYEIEPVLPPVGECDVATRLQDVNSPASYCCSWTGWPHAPARDGPDWGRATCARSDGLTSLTERCGQGFQSTGGENYPPLSPLTSTGVRQRDARAIAVKDAPIRKTHPTAILCCGAQSCLRDLCLRRDDGCSRQDSRPRFELWRALCV